MSEATIQVGQVEVCPILESILWCPSTVYMPGIEDVDPLVESVGEWAAVTRAEDGWLATYVRAYVVKGDGQVGLVDAGVGPENGFEGLPNWRVDLFPFIERLAEVDVTPDQIDWVVSTHMHPDHIGWYARREGESWVPTFGNARYLYVDAEWDHASVNGSPTVKARTSTAWDSGLVEVVGPDTQITPSVRLEPSHGHTPGHVYARIASGPDQALIIGDVIHHKLQLAVPDQPDGTDRRAPEQGFATRMALYERCVDSDIVLIAGHFEPPAVGYLVRRGAGYALEPLEDRGA